MKQHEKSERKMTKQEKAELFARMREDAKDKDIFPESMAAARKFCEALKTATFAPGVSLK